MSSAEDRKNILKNLIKKLHEGANPEDIKREFKEHLSGVPVSEIAEIEEELIKEGLPREEVLRMCDAHIAMFKESIEQPSISAPEGHPIYILMQEHKILLDFASNLKATVSEMRGKSGLEDSKQQIEKLEHIIEHLKDSEKHYLREENVLFPYLEKHGITQPPKIMWMEHDQIRSIKKQLYSTFDARANISFSEFVKSVESSAISLAETLSSHFYKENNILFQMALNVIEQNEWEEISKEFEEIGYCCSSPLPKDTKSQSEEEAVLKKGVVEFETGNLSVSELDAILNTLPIDITFVDKDDKVRYFSLPKDRIFVRTKAVIGREVRACHPQKSLHVVNQILEDFKSGKRDVAEFWINYRGRLVHIRYFAVRDKDKNYLGCLEVTQDITEIKKIEGEKRLLDSN